LYDPAAAATQPADLQEPQELAEAKLADGCAKFRRELDEFYLRQPPADEAGREAYNRLARMRDQLDRIAVASEDSQKELSLLREKLRARISGKIVLVGSTATGAADFVHTPVGARTPGVEAHANILNTILSGAFITDSPPMAGVMAVLAAGALVSLIASTRRVTLAAVLTLALAAFYVTVNAEGVFHYGRMTLAMVAPLLAMLASFLVVTSFRQLTEERAKRQIRGMFSHALSPALVDELIAHPELARLGGQRRVLTCLFSDLAGFTPLTRRLGEQATVQLLRRYFDRMTALVQNRCGGYLNKFLGDGLFVLFGAPVQENDHARRALEAALLCQDAVADFNAELASELGGAVELSARAGVATGEVVVGNCGSSERFDYTAVGDEVNLASRLEGANKFFGTKLLAAESTWLASGLQEKVLARPMGKILLVGIDEPVSVWNPLAMRDALGADKRTAMEQACSQFARAVELFAARKFATAEELFLASGKIFCDDRACQVFAGLCRDYIAKAPAPDWNAAVRLTEK
jgi:adenylate cyclase